MFSCIIHCAAGSHIVAHIRNGHVEHEAALRRPGHTDGVVKIVGIPLVRADVGIAMGGLGSQAAIEAADVVIMNDSPAKIPEVVKISKRTLAIARENVIFALGIKALVLVLGTVGLANMWMAVFADVGVSIIAIINSMRILLKKS